ncbi:hypothetical protein RhiirA5_495576 [Rhizophagus irregularis]|uniref:Uncharacterized protein n=4 Tax=Rhizophagus irregularis TaxID=588596 RepID=A0A2I1E4Z3_9GLOM|nr:hypothetical protein RirG_201350 [Rhizophagus irregularis DAOM 197198w]PKC14212.1 hypothetical protein RhiirA5_495576 [Rhizophagus irregularis]GBC53957.1 hypothetical protein GLOIN_2v1670599 [Rhizophagus irregularis DAOM 181602=DAOM 197198]PKY17190.1 hypothetical protein RhiirB3_521788 [Rhizophagus irregularis]UZO24896.1 hypothetical protein OCT59_017189 [Rhizophagus irregularis]
MLFQGYELEVLINNILLEEYLGPRKNVPYRYTSPNWVDNYQTGIRMESNFLYYIFLPTSSTQFTVRVSSSEASYLKPIVAEIRINGIPTNEMSTSYFPSSLNPKGLSLADSGKRQQLCTLNNQNQQLIGAISVFFYKTESLLQKKSEIPLAVLHLHYRSKEMFTNLIQNKVINFIMPIYDYVENDKNIIKEEDNLSLQVIKSEEGNNIYDNVFGDESLQGNNQILYNNNGEFHWNIQEQPRNLEIIEILDD